MDTNPSLTTGNNAMSEKLGDLSPHAPNRLIVKLKDGLSRGERRTVQTIKGNLSVANVKTVRLTGAEIWELPTNVSVEKALAQYRNSAVFEYIEPDYIVTAGSVTPTATLPNDPSFTQLWGLNNTGQSGGTVDADIDAPEAWDIQTGDPNLVIGVIDSGVDYNHPDLVGNIWTNTGEIAGDGIDNDGNGYVDDIRGWDFAYNDNDPMDVDGHGTHVSGTIAGKGNNEVGVTGVAWNAKIMPLKFLNDSGSGYTSDAILAIDYATAQGVKITNNSWGGGGFSQAVYDAIDAAGQQGSLFIAAAGNAANDNDVNPFYPATYDLDNIVSVAATTRNDELVTLDNTGYWWGSNYGLTSVDLAAPGHEIYSTTPGNNYDTYSGTSMAAPHVAGAAALLWSANPDWTAQQVKDVLMNTGDSLSTLATTTVSGKRLNVYNALAAANLPSVTVSVSPTSVQEDGVTNLVYTFTRTNLNVDSPLTVNFAVSGTANAALVGTDPADYTVLTSSAVTFDPTTKLGTVTFAANTTTATVTVDPIADAVAEIENETVAVAINSGTGYIGGSPSTATGVIISEEEFITFFSDSFANNDNGWSLGTEWEIGSAAPSTGHVYGNPDPGEDNTPTEDNGVAGVVIGGNASTSLHDFYYLTSPSFDTSTANNYLAFEYVRWLNSDYTPYMQNTVDVFDGSDWVNLWSSGASPGVTDDAWTTQTFDISSYKSKSTSVRFGFNVGSSGVYTVSSWNVDDVKIYGDYLSLLPVVTVAATDPSAGETVLGATPNPGQYTLTRTGSTASALTVNIAMSGTATNGADYTTIPTTVTFAAGSATAVVNLNVIDDDLQEGTETATLTVLAGSGYTLSSLSRLGNVTPATSQGNEVAASSATVSIADNEPPLNTITLDAVDMGWYDSTGYHDPTNSNYFSGDLADGLLYRNWFTFNLPTLTAPIISAQLRVKTFDYDSLDASETYELREVTTAAPNLTAGGSDKTEIYTDLGDGAIYGSRAFTNADDHQYVIIDLNGAAISALTAKSGQDFALGGSLTTLDTIANYEYIFGFSSDGLLANAQLILKTGIGLPAVTVVANDASAAETLSGAPANPGQYTLTRTGSTASSLTVNVAMSGTATNGADYTTIPTTVTFAAGSATTVVNLSVIDDALVESAETAILTIGVGTGYTVGAAPSATVNIASDDTAVEAVGNTKLLKDGGNKYFAQAGSNTPISIKNGTIHVYEGLYSGWQTLAAETVSGVNQVLWVSPGTNTMHVWVMDSGWTRTSTQNIGSLTSSAALAQETVFGVDANGDGTIGSPPSVTLAVSPASVTEDGAANLVYTFTRGGATTNALTVNYSIAGTADAADYTGATPGTGKTITFAAGAATATLTLDPTADAVVEANETVALTLATGTGYTIGTTAAVTGTITNDDTAVEAVGNTKLLKDGGNKYFAQAGSNTPISIKNGTTHVYEGIYSGWQTLAAETVSGVNQVLWVSPGTNTMHVWVMDSGWTRTSTQNIGSLTSSAALAQETVFGVDANGDGVIGSPPSVTLAVAPASVTEDGAANLVYTFTRGGATTNALTVNYSIAGTADGSDYTGATPGTGKTIIFAAGAATATLTIDPTADAVVEANETVALTLATGTGYTIGTAGAVTGTITNDDTAVEAVGNTKLLKDGGNKYFAQAGSNTPISIKNGTIHVYEGLYSGWQTLAAETVGGVNQVLWVSPGTNTMHVWVMDSGWTRTSTQNIGSLTSSAALAQETVFGVDANGDGTIGSPSSVTLAVAPASVTEDGAANLVYTFTRGGATTNALTVNYSIAGTADAADYTGATPGTGKTITIAAGAATATLTLDPTADAVVEANETVALTLATGTGYTIGTTAAVTGTITNDDTAVEAVGNTKLLKDGGNKYFAQTGSNTPISIKNSTTHVYEGIYSGWQTLAAETVSGVNQVLWVSQGTNTMHVWVMDSGWTRTSTQIIGSLTSSAALAQETVFGVDANGDGTIGSPPSVTLAVAPTSVTEDGAANLVYTFTRGGATTNALTVNYSIAGTATATDYTGATPGTGKTITIAAGSATATLTLDPTADAVVEANETVALTLATGTGYTIGTTSAVTGTITNDDTAVEAIGNTKLLKDGGNKYFAQAGSNTPISIKNGTTHIYQGLYSGWQTLAAETVSGVNQVLWVSPGTNTMHVWVMDSGWTRTSTQNIGSLTSSAALAQETVFGVDANGDGSIGGLSALTSAEGNTRVVRFGESTVTAPNQISDFVIGADKIDLLTQGGAGTGAPVAFTRAADSATTNINTIVTNVFTDADGATAGNQALGLNRAALVKAGSSTYLIVNDATAGFQSANDLVVNLTGITGTLPALGTIPVGNFFV